MKKTLLICFCVVGFCLQAQTFSEKDFKQTVSQVNSAKTESDYENAFQKFSKFTSTKPTEKWEAYYYAAVAVYMKAELQLKKNPSLDVSGLSSLAKKYVDGGHTQQDSNEVNLLTGLICLQKLQMKGAMDEKKYLDIIHQAIAKADATAPDNPLLAILKAKLAERSNDQANAKVLYEKASNEFQKSKGNALLSWGSSLIPGSK
ncbi:hypothetical protein SAMN05421856_104295 [Chryseobacterium taichungense]|uniref:Tetratricopeptide repeat-containing protein n=1 Tax=Chryseobacterium taichungense TaxID=295069 RepID=A0A1H7ZKJ7_9FLAO|nr:hypothetical protein [Chryseobacterium taichungense]SEM57997.1 hypothetical protein SAMN05421856_104295 [Chryseobacterium taichungense]